MKCECCERTIINKVLYTKDVQDYQYRGGTCNRADCMEVMQSLIEKERQVEWNNQNEREALILLELRKKKNKNEDKIRELEIREMQGKEMPVGYKNSDDLYMEALDEGALFIK